MFFFRKNDILEDRNEGESMSVDLAHLMSSVAKIALRTARRNKENEKQQTKQKNFEYAGAINEQMLSEMGQAIQTAEDVFGFKQTVSPKENIKQLEKIVSEIMETKEMPTVYDQDIEMVAIDLGIYFGHLIHLCYDWSWLMLGDSEQDSLLYIVSPSGHYHLEPISYLLDVFTQRREKHIVQVFERLGKLK